MAEIDKRGLFVTFEGGEGGGKTSQIKLVAQFLSGLGFGVVTTREPGGTPIGDQIRDIIVAFKNVNMDPKTEGFLFLASRSELVPIVIKPNLQAGNIVLCDRFGDSTIAYQGYGYGKDTNRLRNMVDFATDGLWPDMTILMNIRPEVGLPRKESLGGSEWNRLDAKSRDFHERIYEGYQELAGMEPERWRVVDAEQPFDKVTTDIERELLSFIRLKGVGYLGLNRL